MTAIVITAIDRERVANEKLPGMPEFLPYMPFTAPLLRYCTLT